MGGQTHSQLPRTPFLGSAGFLCLLPAGKGTQPLGGRGADHPTRRPPQGRSATANPAAHPPDTDQLPAVHLTHAEAQAYCQWAGGRLPTAAEWRTAGFTELRSQLPTPWVRGTTYPWTTGHSPQGANTSDPDPWPRAAPVNATAAGVNGRHDMGANVWEWAADARGEERRTMGGSWWYPAARMSRPGSLRTSMRCTSAFAACTTRRNSAENPYCAGANSVPAEPRYLPQPARQAPQRHAPAVTPF